MKKKGNKSLAKAAGLKSILVQQNKLFLTSFGKGAEGNLEKEVLKTNLLYEVKDVADPSNFSATAERMNLEVKGNNGISSKPSNPYYSNKAIGMDLVRTKKPLEEKIFGQSFVNDNIHIQIAYQILDIIKKMIPYINDITYSLNSKIKDIDLDKEDFFKYNLEDRPEQKHEPEFIKLEKGMLEAIKKETVYFQEIFYKRKGKKTVVKDDETLKGYLSILTKLRQTAYHFDNDNASYIFNSNKHTLFLKDLFDQKYKIVNQDFIKLNKKSNFYILDKIFRIKNIEQSKIMHENFYDYSILLMGKNLGFSIKLLREEILKLEEASIMLSDDFNSMRGKMYNFFDFIIYHYFEIENKGIERTHVVELLRSNTTEEGKQKIYEDLAQQVFPKIKPRINTLINMMVPEKIKDANKVRYETKYLPTREIKGNFFVYVIYFLTLFLDKKEVNNLTTGIINKLENIDSFNKMYETVSGNPIVYDEAYKMFYEAKETAKSIRLVQVFGLKKQELEPKGGLYDDALKILGFKSKDPKAYNEYYKKQLDVSTGFRNFIINNIIKSKRFIYLIKHVDPENVSLMAKNRHLVEFVLNRIAKNVPAQIDRYYKSITGKDNEGLQVKIEYLSKRISELKYSDFENIQTKHTSNENVFKTRSKAIIGLYLTVLYMIYKGLVNVNSRYSKAYWAFEKDSTLHETRTEGQRLYPILGMVNKFLENSIDKDEPWLKKHQVQIIQTNLLDLGNHDDVLRRYRNAVAHQNAIRSAHDLLREVKNVNSYFELYHIAMQKYLYRQINSFRASDKVKDSLSWADKNNKVSKDLLHVFNLPFAYNTARYKKLSIGDLFDKNDEK